jgi:DNA-binding transcriptional LysR family regulator
MNETREVSPMLDLRLVRSFVAVAETEHVGRAAEQLHISQSPLSRQIQQLEEQLGLRLFDRERRRVRLTDAGRWLLGEARDLLGRAARVEADAGRLLRGEGGVLSIGFVKAAMWNQVLPAALRAFKRSRPAVQVELRALRSDVQFEAIARGALDVGLTHRVPDARLSSTRLFDEPVVLAVPAGHRLLALPSIRPRDLRGETWIGVSRTAHPTMHAWLVAACRRAGFAPETQYETNDRATVLGLVEGGLGVALLPASARRVATPGVRLRALPWLSLSLATHIVHAPAPSAAAQRFVEVALAAAEGLGEEAGKRGKAAARVARRRAPGTRHVR